MKIMNHVLAQFMDRCRLRAIQLNLWAPPVLPPRAQPADDVTSQELQEARERILSGLCALRVRECELELFTVSTPQRERIVKLPTILAKWPGNNTNNHEHIRSHPRPKPDGN